MDNNRLLTTREVAEIFRVNQETIRRWIKSDILDAVKPAGRGGSWRILLASVEKLINQQKKRVDKK